MRRMIGFDCAGNQLAATVDGPNGPVGLFIVSGGNEIRSGAYAGQAAIAHHIATLGHPVFRYDRRGIGDSEGENGGFESSADDIAAAVGAFRAEVPEIRRVVAFGNCDAATALALFHADIGIDALVLANPWVLEPAEDDAPATPTAAAIRARYIARLKDPRSLIELLTGKINIRKLAGGLAKAAQKEAPSGLATRVAAALAATDLPLRLLIAQRDTTALAFMAAYSAALFEPVRTRTNIALFKIDTPSHSFADPDAKIWLVDRIVECLVPIAQSMP